MVPLMKQQNYLQLHFDKGLSTQSEVVDMMLDLDRKKNNCTLEAE
jgi:hypothetical protein